MSWKRPAVGGAKKEEKKSDCLSANLSCHTWNKERTQVAVTPNSEQIWIYSTNDSEDVTKWTKIHTLTEHDGYISAIDWCHETNDIVSCSHDRNAYVFHFDEKENVWKPTLVVLRVGRAATSVKWSPDGKKFAVTTGAKCVAICHFAEEHDFWISKIIKKHKSTVTSVDWCPNNKFIVTGSTDMKCRVFSAYVENIDSPEDDGFGDIWPKQHSFGECLSEFGEAKSWVIAVAWSPAAFRLCFAGQTGIISFVQLLAGAKPIVKSIATPYLPYQDVQFLTDNAVVGGGFDMNPTIFTASGSDSDPEWTEAGQMDKEEAKKESAAPARNAAFNMFQNMSKKGESKDSVDNGYKTKHQNAIQNICVAGPNNFTTCALDGRVLFWDCTKVGITIP